jgi:hypothetical protein
MSAATDVRAIFRRLVASLGDRPTMCVLADALEDAGAPRLARAYRWAAEHGKWPFRRTCRKRSVGYVGFDRKVYDWDRDYPAGPAVTVPSSACLPRPIYRAVVDGPKGRRYGGIHRAFVLLANALEAAGHAAAPC